jgi:hypothetical protein
MGAGHIAYLDANNLYMYGWAMSQPLPSGNFEWSEERCGGAGACGGDDQGTQKMPAEEAASASVAAATV